MRAKKFLKTLKASASNTCKKKQDIIRVCCAGQKTLGEPAIKTTLPEQYFPHFCVKIIPKAEAGILAMP
jgi:hypothetical protein